EVGAAGSGDCMAERYTLGLVLSTDAPTSQAPTERATAAQTQAGRCEAIEHGAVWIPLTAFRVRENNALRRENHRGARPRGGSRCPDPRLRHRNATPRAP